MSLGAMEWLLIFSAMVSALTGAFTGTREPASRLQHAEAAVAAEVAVAAVQAQAPPATTAAPAARLPATETPRIADFAIIASAPLAFVRLNE